MIVLGCNPASTAPASSPAVVLMMMTRSPLRNLAASVLQRLGLETERFGTSTGTLPGLA